MIVERVSMLSGDEHIEGDQPWFQIVPRARPGPSEEQSQPGEGHEGTSPPTREHMARAWWWLVLLGLPECLSLQTHTVRSLRDGTQGSLSRQDNALLPVIPKAAPPSRPRLEVPPAVSEALGEAAGVFLILLLGGGILCTAASCDLPLGHIACVWGAAVYVAIRLAAAVGSPAHLNPAVTIAKSFLGDVGPAKAVFYIAGQLLGATAGSCAAALLFRPGSLPFVLSYGGAEGQGRAMSATACLLHEAWATAVLVLVAFTLKEPHAVGITVAVLISIVGPISGAGLNPARDIGPRIVAAVVHRSPLSMVQAIPYCAGPVAGALIAGPMATAFTALSPRVEGPGRPRSDESIASGPARP